MPCKPEPRHFTFSKNHLKKAADSNLLLHNSTAAKEMRDIDTKVTKQDRITENRNALLIWSTIMGYSVSLKASIEMKADVNYVDTEGYSAIMWAADKGNLDCLNTLVAAKAIVNSKDRSNMTALMWASQNGNESCVKALLAANADPHAISSHYKNALQLAQGKGHSDIVNILTFFNKENGQKTSAKILVASEATQTYAVNKKF